MPVVLLTLVVVWIVVVAAVAVLCVAASRGDRDQHLRDAPAAPARALPRLSA